MTARFPINHDLLNQACTVLGRLEHLFWILGASGSGKSTICRGLAERYGWPVFDMDAHIYGDWHARFDPTRHPVNSAWAAAEDGLAWLLDMSWAEFDAFNRAALPEYVDLLAQDLAEHDPRTPLLVDGGIFHPGLLAQVIPAGRIICLLVPDRSSVRLWTDDPERYTMRSFMDPLPDPDGAWRKFLDFDERIAQTILDECRTGNLPVLERGPLESVAESVARVARLLDPA